MLKRITFYHLIPFTIACGLVVLIIQFSSPLRSDKKTGLTHKIIGEQAKFNGFHANLLAGEQSEINFIGSIKNESQLTIFGSSEFSESPYAAYYYLPDSLGIPAMGIGHAYHQELSILCELLAAKIDLKNSKICIVLSPSWFEIEGGTNVEAFIEFVRPNFLNKIANDHSIDKKYRIHIGEYIHQNSELISGLSPSMKILRDEYLEQSDEMINRTKSCIDRTIMGEHKTFPTSYSVKVKNLEVKPESNVKWEEITTNLQSLFKSQVTNNKMWVNDTYFSQHVLQSNGDIKHGNAAYVDVDDCAEFKDFKLLVELLKEFDVDCCFIIQPLNPFYYNGLDNYNDLITSITSTLDKNQIPYLNLFTTSKKNYEPGTLKDVMHLGDYGWMKVNRFLYDWYHE